MKVKCKELHILLQISLTTVETERMSFRRRCSGGKARCGKFWCLLINISQHESADKLGMANDEMARTKTSLKMERISIQMAE